MTLGALCTAARLAPPNLHIFVMDNESYAYTGAQPTATAGPANLGAFASAAGVAHVAEVDAPDDFSDAAAEMLSTPALTYLVAKVEPTIGHRFPRGFDHVEAKYRFVRHIEATEGVSVIANR